MITMPVITVFTPRPDNVQISEMCISIVTADASATIATSENANATPDAALGGGCNDHFSSPTSGSTSAATMIIGIIRKNAVAVRIATVRAYQNAYRSSGRNNS